MDWDMILHKIVANGSKYVIGWGIGSNMEIGSDNRIKGTPKDSVYHVQNYINKFKLLGLRDAVKGFRLVSDPSCMHPAIDTVRGLPVDYKRVVYHNTHRPWKDDDGTVPDDVATMWDTQLDITKTLAFLASGQYVFTTSYYGMYWGTLLNKRVIVQGNYSSSFAFFKWQPRSYSGNIDVDMANARNYPEALSEARSANMQYWELVKPILIESIHEQIYAK